jgi:nucleotide-binding universal stress UspA family protein
MPPEKILVAVDDSEASRRLLPAVAARAGQSEASRLILFHLVPALPPRYLERRGAEDPAEKIRIEDEQEIEAEQWAEEGERLLADSKRMLERHGITTDRIDTRVVGPLQPHDELAAAIVEHARTLGCGTVAVGQLSVPCIREAPHNHLGDEIRDRAEGIQVWVVE